MLNHTYKACVSFVTSDNEKLSYEREGFETVADATKWVSDAFSWFMLNWYKIDENGLVVCGTIDDSIEAFHSDAYELHCNL